MARHFAGVTSDHTRIENQKQETIPPLVTVPQSNDRDSISAISCPINKCDGRLILDASGYESHTGLEPLACQQCGHRGFHSREGIMLLFRGGYEYKFSYGPSLQTMTILLSSAAVNLWGTHDVNEDQLAKLAAEWALLCGRVGKEVHLGIPAEEFADFYLYFCKHR